MAWDFSTEPEFQAQLDWVNQLVRDEIEPLDLVFNESGAPYDRKNEKYRAAIGPIQAKVREQGLWGLHLSKELGGLGLGQVKLALLNEILGRSQWAPVAFGCQAPDSGNAEILAHYGTAEQKERFLKPLLEAEIVSTYAMTEPQAGADPGEFTCRAHRDGDEWVINGEKWFASNYPHAEFLIVMCITDPDVSVYRGSSMLLVPKGTPGMDAIRNVGLQGERLSEEGMHGYLGFSDCRVPAENLLGEEGTGFKIAQTRLGGGRVHHAMRTIGVLEKAFDMMCERALSRRTKGTTLAEKQAVRHMIADSWIEIEQFRMQVMHTAWIIDQSDYHRARTHIAGVKVAMPKVCMDVVYRAMHLHGSLGMSNEMPFGGMWFMGPVLGIADGPTEVHKDTIARQVLKEYRPAPGLFPTAHLPTRRAAAREQLAARLEHVVGNL